jgi:hypothetical protein
LAFPFLLLTGFLAFPSVIKAEPLSIIKKKEMTGALLLTSNQMDGFRKSEVKRTTANSIDDTGTAELT